jgi:predicted phosphodiesterase
MRIVVVADLHSNREAFEAVLAHAQRGGVIDAVWCLGDIVGYGPEPGAVLELLQNYPHRAVAGNHDLAALGQVNLGDFRPDAAVAARWTGEQLTPSERAYLDGLPQSLTEGDFTLVHGSLNDPIWEYLVSEDVASAHFEVQMSPYCFVGHSHLPLLFLEGDLGTKGKILTAGDSVRLAEPRWVANPGGAGQPRDGDPRTAYALVDTEVGDVVFHRVA